MNIRLNPHSEQLLKEALSRGEFHSAEEVAERALETLSERVPHPRDHGRKADFAATLDVIEAVGQTALSFRPRRRVVQEFTAITIDGRTPCLADTNILIRVSHREDPNYGMIRAALSSLRATGATLCFTSQNLAEFWNVCTRPAPQNGYGLSATEHRSAGGTDREQLYFLARHRTGAHGVASPDGH